MTDNKALEQEAAERYPITQNDANHFLFQTSQRKAYIAGRTASSKVEEAIKWAIKERPKYHYDYSSNGGASGYNEDAWNEAVKKYAASSKVVIPKTYPPYVRFNNQNYLPEKYIDEILSSTIPEGQGEETAHTWAKEMQQGIIKDIYQVAFLSYMKGQESIKKELQELQQSFEQLHKSTYHDR